MAVVLPVTVTVTIRINDCSLCWPDGGVTRIFFYCPSGNKRWLNKIKVSIKHLKSDTKPKCWNGGRSRTQFLDRNASDFDRPVSAVFGRIFLLYYMYLYPWTYQYSYAFGVKTGLKLIRFDRLYTTDNWFLRAIRDILLRNIPIKSIIIYGWPGALYFRLFLLVHLHTRFFSRNSPPRARFLFEINETQFVSTMTMIRPEMAETLRAFRAFSFRCTPCVSYDARTKALLSINMDYRCRFITSI